MKKALIILLAAVLALTAGCGKNTSASTDGKNVVGQDVSKYVTLGPYKGLSSGVVKQEVPESVIEQELASFLGLYGETVPVTDRPVQMGDTASIDYSGSVDGVKFDGGTGSYDLPIGSGSFIPGFEEQVVGMEIGETRDITVTFPDPYDRNPDLAGKEAVFTVTVNAIASYEGGVTDEMVAANTNFTTVEELRENIHNYYESMYQSEYVNAKSTALMEQIAQNSIFTGYPDSQVKYYTDYYTNYVDQLALSNGMDRVTFLAQAGMNEEAFNQWLKESVNSSVEGWLVYQAIARAENITLPETDVDALIGEYAAENSQSPEDFMKSNKLDRDEFRFSLLAEKVTQFLIDNND